MGKQGREELRERREGERQYNMREEKVRDRRERGIDGSKLNMLCVYIKTNPYPY